MFKFIVRRLIFLIPSLIALVTIVFVIVRLSPGDPAWVLLGPDATQESIAAMRDKMGLNDPYYVQYFRFMSNLARGNLGASMVSNVPVVEELKAALPYTLDLTLFSLVIGILFGIPLGVSSALRRNRLGDYVGRVISLAGISMPSFYLGILMMFIFSVRLGILPVLGSAARDNLLTRLEHLVLPGFTMGLIMISYIMRMTRSTMLNVLNEDFVRTAKSKGLPEGIVIYKHALLNALIPLVSLLGIYFISLLGSSLMVEIIYSRPGLGKLMVTAMKRRDYVMLQSVMVIYGSLAMIITLLVDIAYGLIDPRIKNR